MTIKKGGEFPPFSKNTGQEYNENRQLQQKQQTMNAKAKKTRCNNIAPWYRKTIPMSKDIKFQVIKREERNIIVKISWKSEEDKYDTKELIGYLTLTSSGFKVDKLPQNRLQKNNIRIIGGTTPPGNCYHFTIDDETKRKIMKILNE